jgi:hypothetical protein
MNKYYMLIIILITLLSLYCLISPEWRENKYNKNDNINKILINY